MRGIFTTEGSQALPRNSSDLDTNRIRIGIHPASPRKKPRKKKSFSGPASLASSRAGRRPSSDKPPAEASQPPPLEFRVSDAGVEESTTLAPAICVGVGPLGARCAYAGRSRPAR